ncbi:MAG: hypothetical protein JRF27_03360 [Deltaproteobacteria bacterium]|nr:hypothetical protein [Deltaproteobacteria bacterium]MBW2192807.1 hypothetical protein [Deltaproteobacteria bacterium]
MTEDIRDKANINHENIIGLNFIREPGAYVFRKYYNQGLRSQIIEMLDPYDVEKQSKGESRNGILFFPWAKPLKMLRIFRTRFNSVAAIFEEIRKLKIVESYLPRDSYAKSEEFIVDYIRDGKRDFILCGLQEYIEGEVLNPWRLAQNNYIRNLFITMQDEGSFTSGMTTEQLIQRVQETTARFVDSAKKMILETGIIPDLAGVANLILTPVGSIKLVDINNISKVSFQTEISLDDKRYPVCDKSVEAISMLERHLIERPLDMTEKIYRAFLEPRRMKAVKDLEEEFHRSMKNDEEWNPS